MSNLAQVIQEKASGNQISCKTALEIAAESRIAPSEVGKEIDKLGIKITGCQLGCF